MFDVNDERLAIRCDTEMLRELARRAEAEDRSMSSMARRLIAQGLAERANERRETR